MNFLLTVIAFVVIFSVLVLVHEFGHFIAAKRAGILVEEFGMGLPPRLFGKKYGETLYSVNLIPFGGFVRLLGENPESKKALSSSRSFVNKTIWQRITVIVGGVFMNFLLAFVLLSLGFMFGIDPLIINGEDVLQNIRSGVVEVQGGMLVKDVVPGSFAQQAGFQKGDQIFGFDDAAVYTGKDFFRYLQEKNVSQIWIRRGEERLFLDVSGAPEDSQESGLEFFEVFELPRVRVYASQSPELQAGDVILKVNNEPVFFSNELYEKLGFSAQDQLTVYRNQREQLITLPSLYKAPVIITDVFSQSFAEKAGFQSGDRIVTVQGKAVFSFEDIRSLTLSQKGTELPFTILRYDQEMTFLVTPDDQGHIGVMLSRISGIPNIGVYEDALLTSVLTIHPVQYSPLKAPLAALSEMKRLTGSTLQMLGEVVQKLTSEGKIPAEVAGPVGIAQLTHQFVQKGILSLLRFTALLSFSLAVLNILPIPALDGGRLLFLFIEMIRGKRVHPRWEAMIHAMGFALLMFFIIMVTYNDVIRIFTS